MTDHVSGAIGFLEDVRPKFSDGVITCMQGVGLDLSSWQAVRTRGDRIAARLRGVGGTRMPPPPSPPWPEADIKLFEQWVQEGSPLSRATNYSAHFRDLDAHTEYADAYGNTGADDWMSFLGVGIWNSVIPAWLEYADIPSAETGLKQAARKTWLATLQPVPVREAVQSLDGLLMALVSTHFGGQLGVAKMLDAFEYFGRNILPLDEDRYQRALTTYGPTDFRVLPDVDGIPPARAHRMDGANMWFRWAAFIASGVEVVGPGDANHPLRTANMAAIATGCAFDFVFRAREHSRPEYTASPATAKILRQKGAYFATNWEEALSEVQELFQLFTTEAP